jgi:signal transduction histidine kinase
VVTPLLAQEAARPYFEYMPEDPVAKKVERFNNDIGNTERAADDPLVQARFQIDPGGVWSTLPASDSRVIADLRRTVSLVSCLNLPDPVRVDAALPNDNNTRAIIIGNTANLTGNSLYEQQQQLPSQQANFGNAGNAPGVSQSSGTPGGQGQVGQGAVTPNRAPGQPNGGQAANQGLTANSTFDPQQVQTDKNLNEFQARQQSTAQQFNPANYNGLGNNRSLLNIRPSQVRQGLMLPQWVGERLILARRVSMNSADYAQGVALDWPGLRAQLLQSIQDLLPGAALQPLRHNDESARTLSRRLASIPVVLEEGEVPLPRPAGLTPIRVSLLVAWSAVLLGSAAVGGLMFGTLRLGRRREDFVSAVTHELRTPITTVSMYAEMLEAGMVPDEQRRRSYLATLRTEAERLGRLVENVLAFSRLERGRHARRIETVVLCDLLQACQQRLAGRAGQAGLDLQVEVSEDVGHLAVRVDPSAVEQILFNLVDNAAKYAAHGPDKRVVIGCAHVPRPSLWCGLRACFGGGQEARATDGFVDVSIRDFGPGIDARQLAVLFRPFSKSARDAAGSAPGVGLGLALSRRLARQMRGDLIHNAQMKPGAAFTLRLPM